jgi:hypothetical protein
MKNAYKCGHPRTAENSYSWKTKAGHPCSRCAICHKGIVKADYSPRIAAVKKEQAQKRREENPARHMLSRTRISAKRKGMIFSITEADILPLPKTCPVLGIVLEYLVGRRNQANNASLDRKDNSKGYVPGNVFVISYRANILKRDATVEEIQGVLEYMKPFSCGRFP